MYTKISAVQAVSLVTVVSSQNALHSNWSEWAESLRRLLVFLLLLLFLLLGTFSHLGKKKKFANFKYTQSEPSGGYKYNFNLISSGK